jgi:carbon starvation protein
VKAIYLAVFGLGLFYLGYVVYARYIAARVFRLDGAFRTPAHELEDGNDFVPTNRHVLWGHHFTSVAGAAPIVGPAIAIFWGWLPALLWVVVGTIFFAGVHDFGTLWISVRHKARSIGSLSESIIGTRSRTLFLIIIFLLLLMVNAVFAIVIARLFGSYPGSVVPIWAATPIAMGVGYVIYRRRGRLLWPSVASLVALYVLIWLGRDMPVVLPERLLGLPPAGVWVVLMFVYTFFASRLPVWLLLQPRDYINSHQLIVGLAILYVGLAIGNPTMVAPLWNSSPTGAPPILPLLFVTIACGAISGFHGLVSSGTTSKQLDRETDARFVGYLGAVGEGALALGAILAVGAGLATSRAEWLTHYTSWGAASGGAAGFFVSGVAAFASNLGVPHAVGEVFASVVVVSFAATTMDTSVRLQRYIISEVGEIWHIPVLENATLATSLAVGSGLLLAFGAHAPGGGVGTGGLVIWPLFGTTNQLLAGLSLIVLAVYLKRLGRNPWPTLLPMAFLLVMTIWAMLASLSRWLLGPQPNYLMSAMGLVVLGAALWMAVEAVAAYRRAGPGVALVSGD